MTARRILTLPVILSIAATSLGCTATPGDGSVAADRSARSLGIDAYAFEASDEALEVVLLDAEHAELGTVTLAEGSEATELAVELVGSPHTLSLRIRGEASELRVDDQPTADVAQVAAHLRVLEAVVHDPAVEAERGDDVAWRRDIADYIAYAVCFYAAMAGGATSVEAGAACAEIYL